VGLEVRDVLGKGVRLVVDEVVGQAALFGGDLGVGGDVGGVHDGEVQPGLHSVVEEHRVEHGAGVGVYAERDVAHAQDGEGAGALGFDPADVFEGFQCRPVQVLLPGGHGEGEHVEYEGVGARA